MDQAERYSKEDLDFFKELIEDKLSEANLYYKELRSEVVNDSGNGTHDTSPTFKVLEEGALTNSKEELANLAQRQLKFITHLEAALVRIDNGVYGVCRETGKLISKDRLKAVPHATLSIEAKKNRR